MLCFSVLLIILSIFFSFLVFLWFYAVFVRYRPQHRQVWWPAEDASVSAVFSAVSKL